MRTFSFGYKADWAERNASTLGVDDFAHALLGEIKDNSDIRRDEVCTHPLLPPIKANLSFRLKLSSSDTAWEGWS